MVRLKKISNQRLKIEVENYIRNLLEMEIEWNTAFGKTYRKNGDVVEGSLRDTVDMGDNGGLMSTIYVKIRDKGITIGFSDEAAAYIFDEQRGRPEFWDYVMERLPKELGLIVAQYAIFKRLANQSTKRTKGNIRIN
jgi:hypothetical protein